MQASNSPSLPRRQALRVALRCLCMTAGVAPGVTLLGACSGLGGPPVVRLSESELQRLLAQRFPMQRRVLEVLELSLKAPRLRLLAERNRLAAVLDFKLRDRVLGGEWAGTLDFEAALRWDANEQAVKLTQLRVQDLAFAAATGAPTPLRSPAERIGAAVLERMLDETPVYKLPPEKAAELRQRGLVPGAVTVTSRGVEITFAEAAAAAAPGSAGAAFGTARTAP